MAECDLLKTCPFFNDKMANMPSTAELLKKKFCRGDFKNCARYMIAKTLGREKIPPDLFPNDIDKAKKILGK